MNEQTVISLKGSAERLYRRGSKAAYGGDYQTAIYYLQQAVEKEPDNLVYLTDLAAAYNQMAYYEETIQYASYALTLEQSDENRALLCFLMGEAYYCFSFLEQAQENMRRSLLLSPRGRYSREAQLYLEDIDRIAAEDGESNPIGNLIAEENYKLHYARMYYAMGDTDSALRQLAEYVRRCGETPEALEILCGVYIARGDYDPALDVVKRLLALEPSNCAAFAMGMTAAHLCGREELFDYYGKLLLEIRDFMPEEKNYIFNMFDSLTIDDYAKQFFVQNYRDNLYDKDILFGFAAAEYNMGDPERAEKLLRDIEQLEGGTCLATYYLHCLQEARPPERLQYHYQPTVEILEQIHGDFSRLAAKSTRSEAQETELCRLTALLLTFINTEYIGDLLAELPMDNAQVRRQLKLTMLRLSEDPQKKLAIAETLFRRGESFQVNLSGRLTDAAQLLDANGQSAIRRIEITDRLSREYSEEQILYGCVRMAEYPEILRLLSENDEYALLVEILIREKFPEARKLKQKDLFAYYGISPEKAQELQTMLKERGLCTDDGQTD